MFTVRDKTRAQKQVARVRSRTGVDTPQLNALCERLLRAQPQSGPLLERLLARSHRVGSNSAFAPIQNGRCSACNMTVATARIQKAKACEFINCAHCLTFLYCDPR
jgi:hypothetical protein